MSPNATPSITTAPEEKLNPTFPRDPLPPPPSDDVPSPEKTEYIPGAALALVLASLTLTVFLLMLDQSILSTAIPQITSHFHSLSDVGWYTGAYQLANASFQPLTGKFYTHFRAKPVFLVHLFVFELGSLVCGVARSSQMLIAGRAIAGLGAAGLVNGALTILSGAAPLEKRPLYTGLLLGIGQLGILSGPLVGGALTEYTTWRWCFYLNLPIGAISALVLFLIGIPDLTPKLPFTLPLLRSIIPLLDLPGFVLFAPASIMFLLAVQFGGDGSHAWSSPTIIGLFVGAGIIFLLFSAWEWRAGDKAMIPGSILRNRIVLMSTGQVACLTVCLVVASTWLPMYFQAVRGEGPTMSGVDLLPSILAQLLLSVVSGAAMSKLGYYLPWAVFSGAVTTIGNGLISTFSPTTKTASWIGYLIVVGAGRGAGMQVAFIATQHALPRALIPTCLAFLIFAQNFLSAISMLIANTIFTQTLFSQLAKHAPSVSGPAALAAGGSASAVRGLVQPGHEDELGGVLLAYSESLRNVWLMIVGVAGVGFVFSWGIGWRDVRKKDDGEGAKVDV